VILAARISETLTDIVEPETSGSRAEWLSKFECTHATNDPALLFADAVRFNLLVEKESGCFVFTTPGQSIHDTSLVPDAELQPKEVLKPVEPVPYVSSFLTLLRKGASR
jgi:hypothetical protein